MRTGLNSLSQTFSSPTSEGGSKSITFIANVQSVNYSSPNYGEIKFESENDNKGGNALPLFPNISIYPIAGERVLIIDGKDAIQANFDEPSLFSNVDGGVYFYVSILPIWSNPSINANVESVEITNDFPNSLVQTLKPLQNMPGDVLFQGRFGNSIRLGNTNRLYSNSWSSSGEVGNPITIINNGQSPTSTNTENLTHDLSSLYLTSYQQLSNLSLVNENFKSYTNSTKPITPSQYNNPQIILNSDRIILNAKNDSVLISGKIYPGGAPVPDPLMIPVATLATPNLNEVLSQLDTMKSTFVKLK